MITVFLHLLQGLDVVETKLLCHHPTPTPWQTLGLGMYPGRVVWRREGETQWPQASSSPDCIPLFPAARAGPPDGLGVVL